MKQRHQQPRLSTPPPCIGASNNAFSIKGISSPTHIPEAQDKTQPQSHSSFKYGRYVELCPPNTCTRKHAAGTRTHKYAPTQNTPALECQVVGSPVLYIRCLGLGVVGEATVLSWEGSWAQPVKSGMRSCGGVLPVLRDLLLGASG